MLVDRPLELGDEGLAEREALLEPGLEGDRRAVDPGDASGEVSAALGEPAWMAVVPAVVPRDGRVAGEAGTALIDLEATEAEEALADGTFDPRECGRTIASTIAFGWAVSVATSSIKSPRSTISSCY